MQILFQLYDCARSHIVLSLFERKRLFEIIGRVARRHIGKLSSYALMRRDDVDFATLFICEIFAQKLGVVYGSSGNDFACDIVDFIVICRNKVFKHYPVFGSEVADYLFVRAYQLTASYEQHCDHRIETVGGDSEYVEVEILRKCRNLTSYQFVQYLQFFAVEYSQFEVLVLCRRRHFFGKKRGYFFIVARQKRYNAVYLLSVLFF